MKILNKVRHKIIQFGPSSLSRRLTKKETKLMGSMIKNLKIISGEKIVISNIEMRIIKFSSGIKIIGHKANLIEQKIFGKLANSLGLDSSYVKILIDSITRYKYPHVGGAVLSMNSLKEERKMFHPQQTNFLLEEESIDKELRDKVSNHFQPKEGWKCLDVGAFLGHGAMWLRERIGESGEIICVEANEHNSLIIKETVKQNNYTNISTRYAAIWSSANETISFNVSNRQANSIDNNVTQGTRKVNVPTYSIKLLTEELGQAADFISLTVNGAEIEAIEGMLDMDRSLLPKRIVAPAWYPKDGVCRMEYIVPLFEKLGYNFVATKGKLTFAWLEDL